MASIEAKKSKDFVSPAIKYIGMGIRAEGKDVSCISGRGIMPWVSHMHLT
jgi:hypothetical protein